MLADDQNCFAGCTYDNYLCCGARESVLNEPVYNIEGFELYDSVHILDVWHLLRCTKCKALWRGLDPYECRSAVIEELE